MVDRNNHNSLSRRQLLSATAASGIAIGATGIGSASKARVNSDPIYDFKSCTEYVDPFCPEEIDREQSQNNDEVCWYNGECQNGEWHAEECCYDPPQLDQDDLTTTQMIAGTLFEINLTTLFSQASTWYAIGGSSPHWAADFTIHNGLTLVEEESGSPGHWLSDFETNVTIGNEPADLYTYLNPNDEEDWAGATEHLDQYQDYDITDKVNLTADFIVGFVPYLGEGVSIGQYTSSLYNMIVNNPDKSTSINLEYDVDGTGEFSSWARIALMQMDPGQTVTVEVSEAADPGSASGSLWETSTSLAVEAPSTDPESFEAMTTSDLNSQGIERVTFGDIRRNTSKYTVAPRSEYSDDTTIYLQK